MLFTCGSHSHAAKKPASRKTVKSAKKSFGVDLHCHIHTPAADLIAQKANSPASDWAAQYKDPRTKEHQQKLRAELDRKLTSVTQRIADMNKMHIDVQAISTSPLQYYYGIDADLGRQTSRLVNERLAEITATHPDRFAPLATLPMQDPSLAVAELEYCMKKLGFFGVELGTNVNGAELSDPKFENLFAKLESLNAMIFLHPAGFTDPRRISQHFLANIIGNPLDTTLALNHIVFGGVLERHPKLKFVAAHGGGYAGHYPARMDHAYRVRPECHDFITKTPAHYMKKIYYDTMVFSHTQLEHLVNLWGADHVVIGTDYPYDMGYYKPVDFVNASKKLTRKQKDQIIGGNAAKLLNWKLPKKAR